MNTAAWLVVSQLVVWVATVSSAVARGEDRNAAGAIAAQIRRQGYVCVGVASAQRDPAASTANQTVWVLKCENGTYRVRLVPRKAAVVERVD